MRGTPTTAERILALACYFGFAPFLRLLLRKRSPAVERHRDLSLVLFFLLLCCFLSSGAYFAAGTYLLLHHEKLYKTLSVDEGSLLLNLCLFSAWLLLWSGCVLFALGGGRRNVPVLSRMACNRWILRISAGWTIFLACAVVAGVSLATYASHLAGREDRPGAVYMVYDDMGFIPRWVFAVGFLRIARAANHRWGDGTAVLLPLSRETFQRALRRGRFVFMASHGYGGRIYMYGESNPWLDPLEVGQWEKGPFLRRVYLAGCESGISATEWRRALAPAEMVTYARLTSTAEHLLWLWSEGPALVDRME